MTIRSARAKQSVYLFVDESGTSASDPMTLVGATAFHDVAAAELTIRAAYDRALGDTSIWSSEARRSRFATDGFHFAEDGEPVKQVLLNTLGTLDFRAYSAYAANDGRRSTDELLTTMLGTLLSSVLLRYRDADLTVIFEQNSAMDSLYGRIWSVLKASLSGIGNLSSAVAMRGTKRAPCLAVTDYVLGITRVHLSGAAEDFQKKRFIALGRNYAYLIDFDEDRHLGGSKHPIL